MKCKKKSQTYLPLKKYFCLLGVSKGLNKENHKSEKQVVSLDNSHIKKTLIIHLFL